MARTRYTRKFSIALLGIACMALLLLAGCTATSIQGIAEPAQSVAQNLRVAEIALPGMFCQACAQSSERAFENMPGVIDATVDIGTKQGTVLYDAGKISTAQLVQDGLIQAYDGKILNDYPYKE